MKKIFVAILALVSANTLAYGIGMSTSPMQEGFKSIGTEMTGITSDEGGMGLQVRYTQKVSKIMSYDVGLGISGGDRGQTIFAATDYEIYPDYMRQPRISIRTQIERSQEFDTTNTIVSAAPTVSKGFNFWGKEAFPYVAVPFGLSLNSDTSTYETVASLNTGVTGQVPVRGYEHLNGKLELQVGLKDSYTAVMAGLSFPMN
jgi:hypothetical protein